MRKNSIAIVGSTGQLGQALLHKLGEAAIPLPHAALEIESIEHVQSVLDHLRPHIVINTAAYNWVDKAEDEPDRAWAVNAHGPRNLALACSRREITLVHISSDYVFGLGRQLRPLQESDLPGPLSAYGSSKLTGEYFVRALCPRHFVVRTCGLYGHAASLTKGNFVKTMLRVGREQGRARVVDDQRCTPTSCGSLARAICDLIRTEAWGLYHLTDQGDATWYEFAREIFRLRNLQVDLQPISSTEFGARAPRPLYSVLNCQHARRVAAVELPHWRDSLSAYLKDWEG